MAFQTETLFVQFLRRTASTAVPEESSPAVNFLLEERLPVLREQIFLSSTPGPTPTGWDIPSWWQAFGNHYSDSVGFIWDAPTGVFIKFEDQDKTTHRYHIVCDFYTDSILEQIRRFNKK